MMDLPQPVCPLGYTERQIRSEILGVSKTIQFVRYMERSGLQVAECTGEVWSNLQRRMVKSGCSHNTHGKVYYSIDLIRFEAFHCQELVTVNG